MISKAFKAAFAGVIAILFVLCQQSAFAQKDQGKTNEMRRDTTMHQHGMMMSHPSGQQDMGQVKSECQKTDRTAGTAISEIRSARSSNDPKVMKDALDKVEKQLSEIQGNMANAMRMMGNPRGGSQMQSGSTQGGTKSGGVILDRQGNNVRTPAQRDTTLHQK